MSCFAETKAKVGDLAYYLERDMGRVLSFPIQETALNLGEEEVIDDSSPKPSKKRKLDVLDYAEDTSNDVFRSLKTGWAAVAADKEKQKFFEGMAFNNNGAFSSDAI
ncbi:hypothetical protein DCAR_0206005 [Daucus carota subsp. sativus]|uniref:Uncharacterized protein n=1 Tax=Daucus carota subsp. sativus TaxID=79200 RepID=A0A161Y5C4_DAUCS|nr:hypothetical protein DCAR_0206005 [Daucus carota subsp. sativus]